MIDNWEYLETLDENLEEFERTSPVLDCMLASLVLVQMIEILMPRSRSNLPLDTW